MASQQVNAAKLKSTGVNLTNLAAKMKSEMERGSKCFLPEAVSGRQGKSGPADPDLTADGSSTWRIFQQLYAGR